MEPGEDERAVNRQNEKKEREEMTFVAVRVSI